MKTYLIEIRRGEGVIWIARIRKPKNYDPVNVCGNKITYIIDASNEAEATEKAERIYKTSEKYLPVLKEIIAENPQAYIEAMREPFSANFGGVISKISAETEGKE